MTNTVAKAPTKSKFFTTISKKTGLTGQGVSARTEPAVPKPSTALTREAIAKRAYENWVSKGHPVGQDLQNWRDAEAQLRAEEAKARGTNS